MKRIVLKTYGKFIAFLLGIVGFAAGCDEPMDEYGVPSADFRASGAVISSETKDPVPNIRIVGKEKFSNISDTSFTDAQGKYQLDMKRITGFPIQLFAEDIDGEKNGTYSPDSLTVEWSDVTQIVPRDGWYAGTFEKKDANFALKYPKPEAMYGTFSAEYRKMNEENN
ncbi:MAG: radical SAM-associated putative lipoprotein [Petrimonas sp.]|nr:radical SAM-associated putative lipoprotein [Petrimonas sp.]